MYDGNDPTDDRDPDDLEMRTVDGAQSDEPADPAMQAVIEAGGGVSEGFEQAEAQLVDNATSSGEDVDRVIDDAFSPEDEVDRAVYSNADEAVDPEGTGA
jgi:hypothetical protein